MGPQIILWFYVFFSLQILCDTQETGDVRLFKGNKNSVGIVQVYHDSTWKVVCGRGFTNQAAEVTCRQLGYERGTVLPLGAFGQFQEGDIVPYTEVFQECTTGQESRLFDCMFNAVSSCSEYMTAYASVVCRSGAKPTEPVVPVQLDSNRSFPEAGYFSAVKVYGSEIWGRVCGEFWDDNDAKVTCRQLGYYGGFATYQDFSLTDPVLLTELNCEGNEMDLFSCPRNESACYSNTTAAVVCYQNANQEPSLSLVGGKAHHGKLVASIDGKSGLVCNSNTQDNSLAVAACRQLGFKDGRISGDQFDTGTVTYVVLDGLYCPGGDQETLFQCVNGRWDDVSAQCQTTASGISVYCYQDVRLAGSDRIETDQELGGYVEIFDGETFKGVCADSFTPEVAKVICKQLGYPHEEILLPRFLSSWIYNMYNITCSGNEEKISDCTYSLGNCPANYGRANLICRASESTDGYTFSLSNNYYGSILTERYGIAGKVCPTGWDDNDAKVMCKSKGHFSGLRLNIYKAVTDEVFWASNFSCSGVESSLEECGYQSDLSQEWDCVASKVSAGVLCFINEIPDKLVRLADGTSDAHGRAEVFNDVTGWGTICDSSWNNPDARVFCRQAGFADGQTHPAAFANKLPADDAKKVVLSSLRCDGSETSIFQCPSAGWLSGPGSCASHDRDAGVYCYKHVQIPYFSYGPVQFHNGDKYGLVCADGFDKKSAEVICKENNFFYGIPVCCSGFGPSSLDISLSNVQCTGNEASLKDCPHNKDSPICESGHYAGVVCSHFDQPFTRISANPEIIIKYFSHDGYVCSEGFTDADARVVCRVNSFAYGRAFKASGKGLENKIRWLRGLGCLGAETNVFQCGVLDWGQIGVCSWDAVAAAICSNNENDIDFDIRLVNGTDVSGRVEIKVMGEWGTMCGEDFTRNEATVICKQLGFHAGINMPAGHFGPGPGEVILSELDCQGNETSVTECIWSGFGNNNKRCDHTKDAAITCFYNTRLTSSTTNNYGRLEMYDTSSFTWYAVCDSNINVNDVIIICRQMGFVDGMYQQGSPLGSTATEISIISLDCSDTSECSFEKGSCFSGKYVAVYCSQTTITNEYVEIKLPLSSFYGPVSIRRYGLWGHVCSNDFEEEDALVVCSQLGYLSGTAVKTYATPGFPIIQGSVNCEGDEAEIKDCTRGSFTDNPGCYDTDTVAGVICYNNPGLTFETNDLDEETGRMTTSVAIKANGQKLFVSQVKFTDTDAAVYCYTTDYAGGETYHAGSGSYGITDLSCDGSEESILKCPATWDPQKTSGKLADLAGVTCYPAVRLVGGDPTYYGVLFTAKGVNNGPVCSKGFDKVDAGVACSSRLGYDSGVVLCCAPFGDIDEKPVMTNVRCTGDEQRLTDCMHDDVGNEDCSRDYVAIACITGPTEYKLSLPSTDTSSYAGNLVITYMGIDGSICLDGWDDNDAHVACRELGYQTGMAYNAAKSVSGPFWTSQVNCNGDETKLSQCKFTPFGEVTGCSSLQGHAGVICFDNKGVFSRLFGSGEERYGRVELSVAGEWRTICNSHWDNNDANVLCKMLDFRAGEAFQENYNETAEGPVWDIHFMCDGTETALTTCFSSGWKSATSEQCARHENDAGAFCYTSVKLSTGVGRRTDQGGVLFNKDDTWYTLCGNNFTDISAKVVCKELGFEDGLSRCCSPFGDLFQYSRLKTYKVMCTGDETDVTDCLVEEECTGEDYASVVCYGFSLTTPGPVTKTTKTPEEGFDPLPVIIAVVLFVCLVVIFIVVIYCLRKRRKKQKMDASKEHFDNTIIREDTDGSFQFENRLHNPAPTPETSRVVYGSPDGDHFAKISPTYRNPGYATSFDVTSRQEPVSSVGASEQNKPVSDNNTHVYDYPIAHSSTKDPHLYLSLKREGETSQYSQPRGSNIDHSNTSDMSDSTNSHIALANQDEVASPTDDKVEPHFLQVADVSLDPETNPDN